MANSINLTILYYIEQDLGKSMASILWPNNLFVWLCNIYVRENAQYQKTILVHSPSDQNIYLNYCKLHNKSREKNATAIILAPYIYHN